MDKSRRTKKTLCANARVGGKLVKVEETITIDCFDIYDGSKILDIYKNALLEQIYDSIAPELADSVITIDRPHFFV